MRLNARMIVAASLWANAAFAIQKDPISGTWNGWIGRSEANPSSATFNIKMGYDGKLQGKVTGAQIAPGEITRGVYDAKTNTLTFTVWVKPADGSGPGRDVLFEGVVVDDSANGTMRFGTETGMFRMSKAGTNVGYAWASNGRAGVTPEDAALVAVKRGFVEVTGWVTRAAEMVPAEKYSYRPVGTVRTFGEVIAHVADGAKYYCAAGAGKKTEWSDATEKSIKGKDAIVAALKKAIKDCGAAYESGKEIGPLMENVAHTNLHYGNIVTYLRMMGMVPPST